MSEIVIPNPNKDGKVNPMFPNPSFVDGLLDIGNWILNAIKDLQLFTNNREFY